MIANRLSLLIAFAAGVGSAFAFEPAGIWPLMLAAIAILCELLLHARSLRRALAVGWLFGLGQFLVGLNWIATAFTYQAAMPAWLGWIAVVLVSLFLALYPMLAAGLAWRFGRDRPLALVLTLAGSWAITEWLRAKIFTGFAWNPLGVTLVDTPWLGVSTHVGTYGLSMLVVLAGGAIWLLARQRWWPAFGIAAALVLLLTLPRPYVPEDCCLRTFDAGPSAAALPRPEATTGEEAPPTPAAPPRPTPSYVEQSSTPSAPPAPPPAPPPGGPEAPRPGPVDPAHRAFFDVRVVQPNIGQQDKWRPGFSDIAAQRLAALSTQPDRVEHRLLLWPEAAVTEPLEDQRSPDHQAMAEFERMRAASTLRSGEFLLTGGIAIFADGPQVTGAANSVFVLGPDGKAVYRYDKAHLVPYGEYLPMRPLLSALGLSRLAPGDVDFVPGPGPQTVTLPGWGKVGFQICYEIIFSGQVADRSNRPDFIFNPSNDAWFGAWGPPQHLAQARLRAAEEGIPVIRSTPTGISAVVDARGQIVESIPWRTAGAIDSPIPVASLEPTLFARFGNLIPLILGFVLLFAGIALGTSRRYRQT